MDSTDNSLLQRHFAVAESNKQQ